MAAKRKQHTAAFKAQVALAALKGDRTVNELASPYGVHPTLIHSWKRQVLAEADQIFSMDRRGRAEHRGSTSRRTGVDWTKDEWLYPA